MHVNNRRIAKWSNTKSSNIIPDQLVPIILPKLLPNDTKNAATIAKITNSKVFACDCFDE